MKVTREWAGRKIDYAMPLGYSPTMMWILAPLVYFSHNIAFCIFNLVGLFAVWWETHPFRCRQGVGLLAFFSPIALACFSLGQTALIAAASILYVAEKTRDENRDSGWRSSILAGVFLWLNCCWAFLLLSLLAGKRRMRVRIWFVMLFNRFYVSWPSESLSAA